MPSADRDLIDTGPRGRTGIRMYDKEMDESFTVITDDQLFPVTQYDDGTQWDELALPDMLSDVEVERFGVEEGGLDDERYLSLGRTGINVQQAAVLCEDGHKWSPSPDKIWPDGLPGSDPPPLTLYEKFARCRRCGLSPAVAMTVLTTKIPPFEWICRCCGNLEEMWNIEEELCEACDSQKTSSSEGIAQKLAGLIRGLR